MASLSWSRVLPLAATLLLFTLLATHLPTLEEENLLDGCYHVYLDMGTNTGVQVVINISGVLHNFYRLENCTNRTCSLMQKFFLCLTDSLGLTGTMLRNRGFHFPQIRKTVCAVGWEPNWEHTDKLEKLQKMFNACGWKVSFQLFSAILIKENMIFQSFAPCG